MITENRGFFWLTTEHTAYGFQVLETGHLEHLYYGPKIRVKDPSALSEKCAFGLGNTIAYDAAHENLSLENMRLEMSSYGKGDIREPFVEITYADGSFSSDFKFDHADITEEKEAYETLPGSYATEEEGVEQLIVVLKEQAFPVYLELHYYVYEKSDVITRSAKLCNGGDTPIRLRRLLSTQLDFSDHGYVVSDFHGGWAREMERTDTRITAGKFVNASYTGGSSSRANPFLMLSRENTTEEAGLCYGMNLIYSGNHYTAVEVGSFGKTRVVMGINPQSFCFHLEPKETFEAPEAVMTVSADGFGGMSRNMQYFVQEHIIRGEWKKKERPVLLNSWEAAYFDINEKKLLKLAKAGKEAGIELFVMDDGWFGERKDDKRSLGDWEADKKKLPDGVRGLADKINALGLSFGIWVEPEMVNVDSDCYRAHPDWAMDIPGREHSEGRNQRVLDLANPEVVDYIIEKMTALFSGANISYVKWDMNRIFSDCYSKYLGHEQQGETAHRYMTGLYRVMKTLTERFPHILFEGCAAGGNRFDLGILSYFPQIWASDNTDAVCRLAIQTGYSYGYPLSAVSAHVSACPNHQTLRVTPLPTRYHVAAFGVLGYECNFCELNKEEFLEIERQIAEYKKWRQVLQFGRMYRGRQDNLYEWTAVSEDQKTAVGMLAQKLTAANAPYACYHAAGLAPEKCYHFYNQPMKHDIREFGDLINTAAPIHIRKDSLIHHAVAKFVKMDGETEDYLVYGDGLMQAGVNLKQAFSATGYNSEVRYFPDFASRMYFMEEQDESGVL